MKLKDAKEQLRPLGISINRTPHGEYRVNFVGGQEATAAYETDIKAAIGTGEAMWRMRPGTCSNCQGEISHKNPRVTLDRCTGCYDPDDDDSDCPECDGQRAAGSRYCVECDAAMRVMQHHQEGAHDGHACQNRHCGGCRIALEFQEPITFRTLPYQSRFEFYHGDMDHCSGIAHGPWIKVGRLTYRAEGTDGPVHRVGTVAAQTVRL